ncbi:dynamin family protein [Streptomyces sp. NPDC090021]|uniref:dynamin family protein n=1 Tax=Streptomyces sp. NPDC090021 TaxID=3365919 RepID=UPI00382D226F
MNLPSPLDAALARHHGQSYRDSVADALARAAAALNRPAVTLVFGGHFSAGKSSLLNTLLGRDLLPVSDYPETGIACVITPGPEDRVTVCDGEGRREVPATTEAITEAVTLVAPDGAYRSEVVGAERTVTVELAGSPLPGGGRWVDSPGINDTPAMTRRAADIAAQGDFLLWVFNSRQPMATVEEDFLRAYRQRHGAESLALLVNVFLDEDTPEEWQRYLDTRAPAHLGRLEYALDGALPPEVVFVSARAAAAHPDQFGGPQASALVSRLTNRATASALASRRSRASRILGAAAQEAAERLDAERALFQQLVVEAEVARTSIDASRRRFLDAVGGELDRMLERLALQARTVGDEIAAELDQGPVLRDGSYGDRLTERLRTAARQEASGLAEAVARTAELNHHRPPDTQGTRRLLDILEPERVSVEVVGRLAGRLPEAPVDGLGSMVSSRVGTMIPKLSWKALRHIDTAVTAAAASVQAAKLATEAAMPDRAKVKADIRAAAVRAAEQLCRRRQAALDEIGAGCRPVAAAPADPDPAAVDCLEAVHGLLSREVEQLVAASGEAAVR